MTPNHSAEGQPDAEQEHSTPSIADRLSKHDDGPDMISPDGWITSMDLQIVKKQTFRGFIRIFFTSLEVQIFVSLVVLADLVGFIWHWVLEDKDEMDTKSEEHFKLFEWVVLGVCCVEAVGRLLGFGIRAYCRDPWNIFDGAIIIIAVCVNATIVIVRQLRVLRLFRRLVWCARLGRVIFQGRKVRTAMKHKVSQNKSRYVDVGGNFDLDLTYITNTVIAMGIPTRHCIMSIYRNHLRDVVRFFKTKHPDCFRIYNACPEYPYPDTGFVNAGGTIVHFQIQDHTPPTMNQFVEFLTDVHEFRQQTPSGVIAVHCKGGKGRTGSLVSAWLIFFRQLKPEAALYHFARNRTDKYVDKKLCGVETPSQVRYVHQLHKYLESTGCWNSGSPPPPPLGAPRTIMLKALSFEDGLIARPAKMGRLKVLVQCGGVNISDLVEETDYFQADVTSIPLSSAVVGGDVRVSVFAEKGLKGSSALDAIKSSSNAYDSKGIKLFFLFHTDFLDLVTTDTQTWAVEPGKFRVGVEQLDRAHKKVKKGTHAAGSSVVLHYDIGASAAC
jgi:protein-tyrosine phosphatase